MNHFNMLYSKLSATIDDLDDQIRAIATMAEVRAADPYQMRTSNGDLILAPVLVARATALSGMLQISLHLAQNSKSEEQKRNDAS